MSNDPSVKVTPREHAFGVTIVVFILAAMCFMDVGTTEDSLFFLPGVLLTIGGFFGLTKALRTPRS